MHAMTQEEPPRLYSKTQRAPVDEVAGEHRLIHADLERWGRWNRERYQQGMCASLEQRFDSSGGREPSKAIVSLPPDPILSKIEWTVTMMQLDQTPIEKAGRYVLVTKPRSTPAAVRAALAAREIGKGQQQHADVQQAVVVRVEQLGETLTEFYCKGWALKSICWAHGLQYEAFAAWMYDCRSELLRRMAA